MSKYYWTYEYDEKVEDLELKSKHEIESWVNEFWAEYCMSMYEPDYGDEYEDEFYLILFTYNDAGDRVIDERERYVAYFVREKSDYDEHNLYHRGGVL